MFTAGLVVFFPFILAWFYMPTSRWTFVDTGREERQAKRELTKELELVG